jgi:hypothetical protein
MEEEMHRMRRKRALVSGVVALVLTALACNAPTRPDTPTPPTGTAPVEVGGVTPSATVGPTDTPEPDVSGPGGCSLNARYVADVTVPDDTTFEPGAAFTKVWRVRNSGSCDWAPGTQLVYVSGDPLGGPTAVDVAPVAAGANTDLSVDLVAPEEPGTHRSTWQLRDPAGTRFGSQLYVQIVVPEDAPRTPTATAIDGPTVMCTPPPCDEDEAYHCPDECPGGCGTVCATFTPGPCVDPDPAFADILAVLEGRDVDIGCPTEDARSVSGALQEFWANVDEIHPRLHFRSLMIWRSDTRRIYVVDGENTDASEGALLLYDDTWEEGQPAVHPDCAGMSVPEGYQLPVRGFGKVWCVHDLEGPVGWPNTAETAVELRVQPTARGLLLETSGATIDYWIALDFDALRAWTIMVTP